MTKQHTQHSSISDTAKQARQRENSGTNRQRSSTRCLSFVRPVLTRSEACSQLQALGFTHIEKVPASGSGRIPARGKSPNNTSTAICWTDEMRTMLWYEHTTGSYGRIVASDTLPVSDTRATELFKAAEHAKRKAKAKKLEKQAHVATKAQNLFHVGVVNGMHEYVTRKGLNNLYNARLESNTGALLIPMWVSHIGLVNLQRIWPDGTKRFLSGGRVTGAYSVIGSLNHAERVLVCEGWTTGASLFELYGLPVVIAFNAGNLMPVVNGHLN